MKRNFRAEVEHELYRVLVKHKDSELSLHEISELALKTGRIDQDMLDGVRDKAVEKYFGHIMRSESFKDRHGDEVRKYHSYRKFTQTDDGREVQLCIWRTIETMTPAQMGLSAKSRLEQADDIREKVRVDVRWWDENVAEKFNAKPLSKQLSLNVNEE